MGAIKFIIKETDSTKKNQTTYTAYSTDKSFIADVTIKDEEITYVGQVKAIRGERSLNSFTFKNELENQVLEHHKEN